MSTTARSLDPRSKAATLIWLLLLPVLLAILVSVVDPAWSAPAANAAAPGWLVATVNMLPFLLIVAVLLALTRRVLFSSWIGIAALLATYAANRIKLEQLQMPLLPGDFQFLSEPAAALPLFGHYVGMSAWQALIALALLAFSVLLWRQPPVDMPRRWPRVAIATIPVILGFGLLQGWTPWKHVYSAEQLHFEPWSVVDSAGRAGLVGNLVLYHWELADRQNLKPDQTAATDLLRNHADALRTRLGPNGSSTGMPSDTRPDIVIVQSESLFDPARMKGVAEGVYLPNYHRLRKQGLSGDMRVPTFAGGTIRTEFEVLTGMALAFFPGVQYPYFEIADRPLPGIVRTLARHGYHSTAIHPNAGVFWNRNQAFKQLGFDAFIDGESFPESAKVGLFTGDAALTDRVLQELENKDTPQLIFAISMENHGPFDWRPGLDAERLANLPLPEGLDAGGEYWLRNYLYLLEDADHELGRLADALQKRERRTLLLFYGDHLPALPPVYHQLGFKDEGVAKTQPVPWLLLDNGRTLRADNAGINTTSWLLPSILLDAAGITGDRYFAALDALRASVPLTNAPVSAALEQALAAMGQLRYRDELEPIIDNALQPRATDWSTISP